MERQKFYFCDFFFRHIRSFSGCFKRLSVNSTIKSPYVAYAECQTNHLFKFSAVIKKHEFDITSTLIHYFLGLSCIFSVSFKYDKQTVKYVLTILLIQESYMFNFKISQEAKCNKCCRLMKPFIIIYFWI